MEQDEEEEVNEEGQQEYEEDEEEGQQIQLPPGFENMDDHIKCHLDLLNHSFFVNFDYVLNSWLCSC